MFERFTERARQVVVLAQEEARKGKQAYIGPEHILLGLLREEEGLAARVLASLDVTIEKARDSVEARVTGRLRDEDELAGQIPFTPRTRKALELSLREAISLGHNYIGTEHVLLGVIREYDNTAVEILKDDFAVDVEHIRNEVMRMLSGPNAPQLKKDRHSLPDKSTTMARLQIERESEDLLTLLDLTATLARMLPDLPVRRIAEGARRLHAE